MIARLGSGWQTVLADLSLILFMITAAAVSQAPAQPAQLAPPAAALDALALGAASGRPARVLIEPGMQGLPIATLTYDQAGLAHRLREPKPKETLP